MSTVYNLEPQAQGLILLRTNFGDLEVELFTKQCPKNTKKFVQLCLDGYYDGTIFDRIDRDFLAVGGKKQHPHESNPESCDVQPDEFHQRLRFSRRGLLATANTDKDQNGPEFFFTLGPAPELQNKHTIFGRIKGNSVFCLVDLNDCPVIEDDNMRPVSEKKILQAEVVDNPYPELNPRRNSVGVQSDGLDKSDKQFEYLKPKIHIKNSKKLSYSHDSDEEEDFDEDDDKLSDSVREPEVIQSEEPEVKKETQHESRSGESAFHTPSKPSSEAIREKKLCKIRGEIQKLKQRLELESATKIRTLSDRRRVSQDQESPLNVTLESRANSSKQSSIDDVTPASLELRMATKKGRQRERETIDLMEQFKKKLKESKSSNFLLRGMSRSIAAGPSDKLESAVKKEYGDLDDNFELDDALNLVDGDEWLSHKFDAKSAASESSAKAATTEADDWYSIEDPHNHVAQQDESSRARHLHSKVDTKHEDHSQNTEVRHHRHKSSVYYHHHR